MDVFKKRNKKIDTHHIHKYNKHKQKIKELMEIPRCLDTYVNDYQMHVFEVAWLTEEQISHFRYNVPYKVDTTSERDCLKC